MYAEKHGDDHAPIDAVIRGETGGLFRLDLKDPTVRSALTDAITKEQVLKVFSDHGGSYV